MATLNSSAFVALLRGINVGGKNKLPMKDLAGYFVDEGCTAVATFIQSGNVVFRASDRVVNGLEARITQRIAVGFGYRIPVVLRSRTELLETVAGNPFLERAPEDEKAHHVMFLEAAPDAAAIAKLEPERSPGDELAVRGRDVYLYLPGGIAKTRLTNAWFDSKLKTVSTARNWRTVLRLAELHETNLPVTFQMHHLLVLAMMTAAALTAQVRLPYPVPPRGDQVNDLPGGKVADPYRVLENADAPATKKFVEQENALTFGWLAKVPGREEIRKRLTRLWDYERFTGLYKAAGKYFYRLNTGLQNQSVVYVTDSLTDPGRVLLDPNTYRKDGTAALANESVSWNGKLYAYAVAQAGSDWDEWRVRDVATGKDLPDLVRWSKGASVSWAADDSGFYYSRFPEPPPERLLTAPALNQRVCFHRLGDSQTADKLVYERPGEPAWTLSAQVMEGSPYVIFSMEPGEPGKNLLAVQEADSAMSAVKGAANAALRPLMAAPDASYHPIAVAGSLLYVFTTERAPRGRVITIDLKSPERAKWREIVPEQADTLEGAQMADGKLLLTYMKDAHSAARVLTLEGKPIFDAAMPGLGTAMWEPARLHDREVFFSFTAYTQPSAEYRLDLTTGKSERVRQGKNSFRPQDYETRQAFYRGKDGTRVPLFISARKGIALDGKNPTILYGYGGFDIALTPSYSPAVAAWMEMGGVYAVANLRGGSEYGEAWHQAGMLAKKQNVFDDFIAAGEWLIANHYTSTPKLAIFGGSNGGLLVGAVLNQRPDLFGAAMPAVGVMDMLRFHKFGFGTQWVGEYGSPENAADFPVLRAYSPLHNVKKGAHYPPTLITTADHDDRVMPGHSLKYAAALQQAQAGSAPILLRVETRAGHGAGKPVSKQLDEWADRFAFLTEALRMKPVQ